MQNGAAAKGHRSFMSHRTFVGICLLPLLIVTAAFFLIPMAQLVVVGADGPRGLGAYLAIVTEPRYRATLINTVLLATTTTLATLLISTIAGMFLQRRRQHRRSHHRRRRAAAAGRAAAAR
jgi:putative spermidine/putrescine transport system permease protein